MKFGILKSIGHNIADSFASGISLLLGYYYEIDVFGEAAQTPEGYITIDFLNGIISGGQPSSSLARGVELYKVGLSDLCAKHQTDPSAFSVLTVKFSGEKTERHFQVTVADQHGRTSVDNYFGVPGKRPKVLDDLGRIRKNYPSR